MLVNMMPITAIPDKANMKEVMKGAKESGVHFKVPNGQGHF